MKAKEFTAGQEVWIYFGTTSPREGVCTRVTEHGSYVRCYMGERFYCEMELYARPQDHKVLAVTMQEDAFHLNRCAEDFEIEEVQTDERLSTAEKSINSLNETSSASTKESAKAEDGK